MRLGIQKAKGEIILIQDADLEYNPENYYDLIEPILKRKQKLFMDQGFLVIKEQDHQQLILR